MPNRNLNISSRTLKLSKMGLLVAVAVVCGYASFPILPFAPFLKYEPADIPILIAGFVFGPIPGFIIGAIAIVLNDLTGHMMDGGYGMIMHIISAGTYVLVAGGIYKKFNTKKGGLIALITGGLAMTAVMIPANIIVVPFFIEGTTIQDVFAMIAPILLPFNLLKTAITSAVVFLLYKRLSPFLHKW